MGYKRERQPGVWELIANSYDPVTGKRRPVSRTFHGGARAAEQKLNELVTEVGSHRRHHGDARMTLAELLEIWLEAIKGDDLSPTTLKEYRRLARNQIAKATIGKTPLHQLTAGALGDFYRALRRGARGRRSLSSNSVRNTHRVIKQALDHAVLNEWLESNPAMKAKRARGTYQRRRSPTGPETVALVGATQTGRRPNDHLAAFYRLKVATGARRGEMHALRRSTIDVEASTVRIHKALVEGETRQELVLKDTKTHQERTVQIGPQAMATVVEHLVRLEKRAADAGVDLAKDPFLFSDHADCSVPWHPDKSTDAFRRLRTAAGVEGVVQHGFRHRKGSQLIDAGIPLPVVSEILGHGDMGTTAKIYVHAEEGHGQAAADVDDDLFG